MSNVQQIKLYNPSKPQLAANDVVYGRKPFITCLKYGRQTGKSYWALMDMINRGMNTPNQKIRFITPAYSLATKHMQTNSQDEEVCAKELAEGLAMVTAALK